MALFRNRKRSIGIGENRDEFYFNKLLLLCRNDAKFKDRIHISHSARAIRFLYVDNIYSRISIDSPVSAVAIEDDLIFHIC